MTKTIPHARNLTYLVLAGLALATAVTVASGAYLGVLTSNDNSSYVTYTTMLALLMLVLAVAVLLTMLRQPNVDLLEVVIPLTVLFSLHYPVRAIFITSWPELARLPLNWPSENDYYIFQGLLTSFIGFVFFYLGYFWKSKDGLYKFLPKIPFRDGTEQLLSLKISAIFIFGVFAFIMLSRSGAAMRFMWDDQQIGTARVQLWNLFEDIRYLSLLIAWAAWKRGVTYRCLGFIVLITNIGIGVAMGSKDAIFVSILAILLAFHYMRTTSKQQLIWMTVALISVFLMVVFPLVEGYRESYRRILGYQSNPTIDNIIEVVNNLNIYSTDSSQNTYIQDAVTDVVNRAVWFDSSVMIQRWVPEYIDYQRGATFYPLIIGWIPRAVWPEKPILSQGSLMHNVIIGSSSKSNVGLTSIGELYLNFGIVGVISGMFFIGVFVRLVYLYTQNFSGVAIYRSLLYFALYPALLFSLQSSISTAVVGIVRTMLVVILLIAFLSISTSTPNRSSTRAACMQA